MFEIVVGMSKNIFSFSCVLVGEVIGFLAGLTFFVGIWRSTTTVSLAFHIWLSYDVLTIFVFCVEMFVLRMSRGCTLLLHGLTRMLLISRPTLNRT